MTEEWRPVAEYEGIYEVSDAGRVRRMAPGKGARAGHILKPWKRAGNGIIYPYITLTKNGIQLKYAIHRLVWETFNSKVADGNEVHHLDNNPSNNALSNLREVSHKENMEECVKAGRQSWGEKNGHCKLTSQDIADIQSRITGEWGEITKIAREYGVSKGHISNIATGLHRKIDGGKVRESLHVLSVDDVRKMRALYQENRNASEIGRMFGVCRGHALNVIKGVYWKNVE